MSNERPGVIHHRIIEPMRGNDPNWGSVTDDDILEWGARVDIRLRSSDSKEALKSWGTALRESMQSTYNENSPISSEVQATFLNLFLLESREHPGVAYDATLFSILAAWGRDAEARSFLRTDAYQPHLEKLKDFATIARPVEAFRLSSEVTLDTRADEDSTPTPPSPIAPEERRVADASTSGTPFPETLYGVIDDWFLTSSAHIQLFQKNRFDWLYANKRKCPTMLGGIVAWSLEHPEHYQVISGYHDSNDIDQCRAGLAEAAEWATGPHTSHWIITLL